MRHEKEINKDPIDPQVENEQILVTSLYSL